eukprot:m.215061 g.215061  ORF g.215061 m.215061 type:complete len:63 (+) comp13799_c0_seq51:240-428(+)
MQLNNNSSNKNNNKRNKSKKNKKRTMFCKLLQFTSASFSFEKSVLCSKPFFVHNFEQNTKLK